MADTLTDLASLLSNGSPPKFRIALVTAVDGEKLKTDVTGEALVNANADGKFLVADRVLVLLQGSFAVVVARLSGGAR